MRFSNQFIVVLIISTAETCFTATAASAAPADSSNRGNAYIKDDRTRNCEQKNDVARNKKVYASSDYNTKK